MVDGENGINACIALRLTTCHSLYVSTSFGHFAAFVLVATMSSRISIARPQTATYNADPHGLSNSRPSSTGYRAANPDDPIEKLQAFSKQVEDWVDIHTQPLKPHLPAIGRFLIVVTFIEDALRITTQWGDQLWYLQQ
jgi:ER-derived vesicles protein